MKSFKDRKEKSMEDRKQKAKEWLKKDLKKLDEVLESGNVRLIKTLETRIRIHQLTIEMSK